METLQDYLDALEEILESSKAVPFSNRVSVDRERIFQIVSDIRLNLPTEIRQAQRVIEGHDRIVSEAKAKADSIIREAESEAKLLTGSHEIFRRANEQADEVINDTKRTAREIRLGANDYADDVLAKSEAMIREVQENMDTQMKYMMDYFNETLKVLYENRQLLRG